MFTDMGHYTIIKTSNFNGVKQHDWYDKKSGNKDDYNSSYFNFKERLSNMKKMRLDELLVSRGFMPTIQAKPLIMTEMYLSMTLQLQHLAHYVITNAVLE